MTDPTLLVNASHPLPPDWEPDDLVDLWEQQPRHFLLPMRREFLSRPAFEAVNALSAAAVAAGFDDFEVRSAYRGYKRQEPLFAADPESGLVAKPGQSEHQTGLALDVGTWKGPFLSDENARHRAWVAEHCWDFGLVIRYPAGKEDVTGVPAEPWHLRYVGRDVAAEMRDRGWVFEEWHELRRTGA
ncbi:MAG: M15 family metallopeptidase [Eggerthellaceae bacterium]|nr:M15 family metallopeptidase [Eggerthellaceae bacterium]